MYTIFKIQAISTFIEKDEADQVVDNLQANNTEQDKVFIVLDKKTLDMLQSLIVICS